MCLTTSCNPCSWEAKAGGSQAHPGPYHLAIRRLKVENEKSLDTNGSELGVKEEEERERGSQEGRRLLPPGLCGICAGAQSPRLQAAHALSPPPRAPSAALASFSV